jgi:YHS domain-containing protein
MLTRIALVAAAAAALVWAGCAQQDQAAAEKPAAESAAPAVDEHAGHDHSAHDHSAHEAPAAAKELVAQKTCPVMGGAIDKKVYVDHEGLRVYFCCDGCQGTFKKDPAKYLKKLEELGEKPEKI